MYNSPVLLINAASSVSVSKSPVIFVALKAWLQRPLKPVLNKRDAASNFLWYLIAWNSSVNHDSPRRLFLLLRRHFFSRRRCPRFFHKAVDVNIWRRCADAKCSVYQKNRANIFLQNEDRSSQWPCMIVNKHCRLQIYYM